MALDFRVVFGLVLQNGELSSAAPVPGWECLRPMAMWLAVAAVATKARFVFLAPPISCCRCLIGLGYLGETGGVFGQTQKTNFGPATTKYQG